MAGSRGHLAMSSVRTQQLGQGAATVRLQLARFLAVGLACGGLCAHSVLQFGGRRTAPADGTIANLRSCRRFLDQKYRYLSTTQSSKFEYFGEMNFF